MTDRRLLTGALWTVVLLALVAVGASSPHVVPGGVTEVYLLNESGVAANYPADVAVGETGTVVIGVHNDRAVSRTYTVDVRFGDRPVRQYVLEAGPGERDERRVSFTPRRDGTRRLRVHVFPGEATAGKAEWRVGLPIVVESESE